uniref:GDNF/GAS1 domain-containing protein n=1 Tax=Stegastes partitus TaxID=144197 RepID=A0A3B5BMS3_9TELE
IDWCVFDFCLKCKQGLRSAEQQLFAEPLDCVRASELCNQNSQCSSRYRIMRQCLSGGDKERSAMLASRECQGALEVLQDSPLYDCRCKRAMKKELQCLQNYWSIHMGLTEGKNHHQNHNPSALLRAVVVADVGVF